MAVNTFRQIDAVFTIICIAVAIFFTAHCIYQYCKNEDSSVVTFSEYHSGQDTIYPGLTLCFRQYYRKETFSDKNEKDTYLNRYLEGKTLFKNNRERKRIADRFNRGRKKGKQANQEEVIKSIKRKFEDLYHNNTAINIEDYLLFGLTKYSNAGMAVYEFPKNARWKMSNVGEQILKNKAMKDGNLYIIQVHRIYSSDVGLLRYLSMQGRKLRDLVLCSTNQFFMKVNALLIKILRLG